MISAVQKREVGIKVKRKTKEQREAEEKAALRRSIEDIVLGAEGDRGVLEDDWFANATTLSRLVPALRARFGEDSKGEVIKKTEHLWWAINLDHYENVDSITNFLFDHGVRI